MTRSLIPVSVEHTYARRFSAVMRNREFGALKLSEIAVSESALYRDPGQEHDVFPSYMLCYQVEGMAELFQGGRSATLQPGEFTVYDAKRPMRIEYGKDFRCLAMLVPQHLVNAPPDAMSHLTAVRMGRSSYAANVIGSLLHSVDTVLDSFTQAGSVRFASGAVDAISATFDSLLGLELAASRLTRQERLRIDITEYIEQHLSDPLLSPDSVAKHFFISLRTVQQLFSSDGGVATTIRERRLSRAERLLEDPFDASPVATVARRCGFGSHSHFSSAFKANTGESPAAYRERHRALVG
ncbi:helix-turn-helix domain-containing protein [Arthrobacter sulfonylureivorans]|uniref:Helix-turn-helix domain-containing protein n=1 Tax=Arthrobacter sulfonylureivorans TaxID=2486855 RepID=A0ABY3WBL5_9MICC|nr:helix-turn-helix domain-containing protein [Arthrobacter sulfonylureivorans]UNK47759.1 helix-turn-helix domain-containing protein [Arthrobacter sulfonylureivorans]